METEFKIEEKTYDAENVIYMQISVPYEEMRDAYRFFMKLGIHVFSNGGRAPGPCFFRYTNETPESIDMEVCLVVDGPLPETEEIFYKELPKYSGKFAIGYCKGPYTQLPNAYADMKEWFVSEGLVRTGEPMIERFLNYRPHMDENELLTELIWPIE